MLKQKLKTSFLSKLFVQALQLVATIVVARVAGPEVLGTVAFGLAFVNMFAFIGNFGLGSAHIKIVSETEDHAKCAGTFAILHIFTKMLFLIVVVTYFILQKYVFHFPFESKEHEIVIIIFMAMILFKTLSEIPQGIFLGEMKQAKQDIPEIIRNLFLQPARIISVLLGGTAVALASVNLLSAILILPVYWILSREIQFGKFDMALAKRYLKYGLPLLVLALAASVSQTIDKVLLQYFINSESVGYYTAGFRIGGYFMLIGQSAALLFYPFFSRSIQNKREGEIREKVTQYETFVFKFVMPIMLFLSIYSQTIISLLLGPEYVNSIPIFSIIIVAQFFYLLNIPYGNIIIGMGQFKEGAAINIVYLILFAGLLVFFIHPNALNMGGLGAAYAFFISRVLVAILFIVFANKNISVFNIARYFRFLLYGILFFAFSFALYKKWIASSLGLTIVFPILYFSFFYLGLSQLGWINKQDWHMLISVLRIKPMITYIREEILQGRGK